MFLVEIDYWNFFYCVWNYNKFFEIVSFILEYHSSVHHHCSQKQKKRLNRRILFKSKYEIHLLKINTIKFLEIMVYYNLTNIWMLFSHYFYYVFRVQRDTTFLTQKVHISSYEILIQKKFTFFGAISYQMIWISYWEKKIVSFWSKKRTWVMSGLSQTQHKRRENSNVPVVREPSVLRGHHHCFKILFSNTLCFGCPLDQFQQ